MKWVILILFSFFSSAYANEWELILEQLTEMESLSPQLEEGGCSHCEVVGEGEPCGELNLKSCEYSKLGDFCFNGKRVKRDSANKYLMGLFCTNQSLEPDLRLQFGSCQKGEILENYNLICYCQFQQGLESKPLAFHCTGK